MLMRWAAWLALSMFICACWLTYRPGDADDAVFYMLGVADDLFGDGPDGIPFRMLGGAGGGSASGVQCSGPSGDSGRRLAGATIWYCERWEKEHVEACMAIPMILLAIVFETAFHHVKHKLEHSYVFGQSMLSEREQQAMRNAAVFGKPLKLSFITRMGGEFMVLGFLAVVVWTVNRTGIFNSIAGSWSSNGDIHMPTSGGDYLHLAETVHMILFIAMVFYFSFTFVVVEVGLRAIAMFESMRAAMIDKLQKQKAGEPIVPNKNLDRFSMLRAHFMNHGLHGIMQWRVEKPKQFARVVESMGLDETNAEAITMEELRNLFQGCFSFATFLSFAVREKVEDLIEIRKVTWLFIICILILMAVLHLGKVRLKALALFFQGMTVVIIMAFVLMTRNMKRFIVKYHNEKELPHEPNNHSFCTRIKHGLMGSVMLLAQILMFFNSFVLSYMLVDMIQDEFKTGTIYYFSSGGEMAVMVLCMLGCLLFQVVILPLTLTEFMYLEALPPQDTAEAQELILYILQAGGAQGAAWAPYVDEKNAQMVNAANRSRPQGKSEKTQAQDKNSVVLLGKSTAKNAKGSQGSSKGTRKTRVDISAQPVPPGCNTNRVTDRE